MGVHKGEAFTSRDVYPDYDSEAVTYRQDHRVALICVYFYGTAECPGPVAYHNRLFSNALRFGRGISCEECERDFPFH